MIYLFTAINVANLLLIVYCIVGAVFKVWSAPAWLCAGAVCFAILVKILNVYTIKDLENKKD